MPRGKCALVTGATGGLGYAIAEKLAAEGCNVVVNGLLTPGEMRDALARHGWPGGDVDKLIDAVWTIDRSEDAGQLMQLAAPRA